jgi:1-acyl-sn-glycerol-3-phosphate acyltransferase
MRADRDTTPAGRGTFLRDEAVRPYVPAWRGSPTATARHSPALFRFFSRSFARFFVRHMNSLRLAQWGGPPHLAAGEGPLVVYSNHPAWWDGVVYILAASQLFPGHEHYAPLDATMLDKYRFFGRIGGYGIDLSGPRGAAAFLRDSADILSRPNRAIWIAAQGRFSDVRERPLALKPGIVRLCELAPGAVVVPLAIEYAFWTERGGEACLAFGEPCAGRDLAGMPRRDRLAFLETALTRTLDRLSADVITRDPARFEVLLAGRAGVGGIYDRWKALVAGLKGNRWDPAHERKAS